MAYFSVILNDNRDEFLRQLCKGLARIKDGEFFKIKKQIVDKKTCIYSLECIDGYIPTRDSYNAAMGLIASTLSAYIVDVHEKTILKKVIDRYYYYFNKEEKEIIYANAISFSDEYNRELREYKIEGLRKSINDFLCEMHEINLEGFISFRGQNYLKCLREIADRAVDEYLMEREYNDFIKLLKYFVDLQSPKLDTINIIIKDDTYQLLDGDMNELDNHFIESAIQDSIEAEMNRDDILISFLLTMAPVKIYIHSVEKAVNKEIIETIINVFGGRVSICGGCNLCNDIRSMIKK
ncbi:putative sporulation protein YtxC [Calorimonas adulescens]|uniref:Putative sporulation protein YtxC n=1 Tax=Calorimonas adulescens TaxID=2606906 RepID=A0A5D8QE41_9THEO|nr:putative sporulation protein YtxC [Calorimonas adulescens]TZE82772.1 putative sporulation protein YtxC [Calorimonas adulescens]